MSLIRLSRIHQTNRCGLCLCGSLHIVVVLIFFFDSRDLFLFNAFNGYFFADCGFLEGLHQIVVNSTLLIDFPFRGMIYFT